MLRKMLKSKIHGLTVTETALFYQGSLTVDRLLLDNTDMLPGEMVLVVNMNNGARFETYLIEAPSGSGTVCLNGPTARLGEVGDKIHVISYAYLDAHECAAVNPIVLNVDAANRPVAT
jgi:aspartate 1-decarboxylase